MPPAGLSHDQIAPRIGVRSPKTLRKYFREELDSGVAEANYQVAKSLFQSATTGDTRAAMYWLNCRAGWQPRVGYERPASAPPPFVVAKEEGVQQP